MHPRARGLHSTIYAGDVGAEREHDVINEERVDLIRLGEGRKKGFSEASHDRIVVGPAVTELQSVNVPRANVVRYLFERRAGQIERETMRRTV